MKSDQNDAHRESAGAAPAPASTHGSGKGSNTALEALIRQRRMVETPDERDTPPESAGSSPAG